MMVNWEFFDNQTPSSARDLVDGLRAGERPCPTRGAPLCTFRETACILAGLPDATVTADGQVRRATLAGLRVAHELDMTAPARRQRRDATEVRRHKGGSGDHEGRTGTWPVGNRAADSATTETEPSTTDSATDMAQYSPDARVQPALGRAGTLVAGHLPSS